jgi:hypothetical protein
MRVLVYFPLSRIFLLSFLPVFLCLPLCFLCSFLITFFFLFFSHACFVFGRSRVQICARRLAALTVFSGISQSHQVKARIL